LKPSERIESGLQTRLVKGVETETKVKKVRTECIYQNHRIPKKDRKRFCSFKVKVNKKKSNAKVWVTPNCATQLKARVRIVFKAAADEKKTVWQRTWRVKRDTSSRCSLTGNG